MPFPLAIPVALSAIQALIKFRGRLDTILSLNQTTAGLPFALPPAPTFDAPHIEAMVEFFRQPVGQNILVIRGLSEAWKAVEPKPRAPEVQEERGQLMRAYYEAADVMPERLGPDDAQNRAFVTKGPSKEMRLAYYVVESHRLSRNPAVTRVLLTAADTLLEFGADNAGLFAADPRTRGLIETLLREFAVERDWDDASGEIIFKTLLGSAAVAALEHRGELPDQPLLQALFDALGEVQQEMGAEFVANLVTRDGFQKLIGRFLVEAADQPGLFPDEPLLKETLTAMLRETGENLDTILGDPKAIVGVLEAGIAAAARSSAGLIDAKVGDRPLLAVVLKTVAQEFEKAGETRQLFRKVRDGELLTALYQASLRGLAADPELFANQTGLKRHVAKLVTSVADELSKRSLIDAFSAGTVRALAVQGLNVLSTEPEFLAAHGEFAAKVLGATLAATASALEDGLSSQDLREIVEATLKMASANLGLIDMDENIREVLSAVAITLTAEGLGSLASKQGRKAVFFGALEAVAANPKMWDGFAEKDLVTPIVEGILQAFATDKTGLLSGNALVPAFRQTLAATARRGKTLLEAETTPARVQEIMSAALVVAESEIGTTMDSATLPDFLQRVLLAFLAAPFDDKTGTQLETWVRTHVA